MLPACHVFFGWQGFTQAEKTPLRKKKHSNFFDSFEKKAKYQASETFYSTHPDFPTKFLSSLPTGRKCGRIEYLQGPRPLCTGFWALNMCFFFVVSFDGFFEKPNTRLTRHPNTSWECIRTLKTYPKKPPQKLCLDVSGTGVDFGKKHPHLCNVKRFGINMFVTIVEEFLPLPYLKLTAKAPENIGRKPLKGNRIVFQSHPFFWG